MLRVLLNYQIKSPPNFITFCMSWKIVGIFASSADPDEMHFACEASRLD